jgi:hypothetical protein
MPVGSTPHLVLPLKEERRKQHQKSTLAGKLPVAQREKRTRPVRSLRPFGAKSHKGADYRALKRPAKFFGPVGAIEK